MAVSATLECIASGESARKRPELWAIWGKCGGKLKENGSPENDTQFEAWRDELPAVHKDAADRAADYPPNDDDEALDGQGI